MLQLGISKLSNIQIIALGINLKKLISKASLSTDEKDKLKVFYTQFEEALTNFMDAGDRHKDFSIEQKQVLQNKRREIFIGLKFVIKGYLYSQYIEQRFIAKKIKKIIKKNGWDLSNYSANEQSAKLAVIIDEINRTVTNEELEIINVTQWMQTLEKLQNEFVLYSVNLSILESQKANSPSELRPQLNENIKKLINSLPYQNEITPSENLRILILSIDKVISEAINPIKNKKRTKEKEKQKQKSEA